MQIGVNILFGRAFSDKSSLLLLLLLVCFGFVFLKSKGHGEVFRFWFFINLALTIFPKQPAVSHPL